MEGEDVTEKFMEGAAPEHSEEKYENVDLDSDTHISPSLLDIRPIRSMSDWKLFGRLLPKNEVIFICQVVILYIVIITCIVNLTMRNGDSNLWTALLSSSLGIMLPQPTLATRKR